MCWDWAGYFAFLLYGEESILEYYTFSLRKCLAIVRAYEIESPTLFNIAVCGFCYFC